MLLEKGLLNQMKLHKNFPEVQSISFVFKWLIFFKNSWFQILQTNLINAADDLDNVYYGSYTDTVNAKVKNVKMLVLVFLYNF